MAKIDGFFELPTKVRKDPLGHGYINALTGNENLVTQLFGIEHYLSNDVGAVGGHNAREIARSGAVLTATGGPPATGYSIDCPDGYLTIGSTPEAGELRLTLASGQGTANKITVQLQGYAVIGTTGVAALHWAKVVSATEIRVYTEYVYTTITPGSGTELHIAARTDFGILVYSEPTEDGGMANALPDAARRGIGLRSTSIWNKLVQRDGDLRAAIDVAHEPDTGAHSDFRIPRRVIHASYDGAAYDIVTEHSSSGFTLTKLGTGHIQVQMDQAPNAPFAPFVSVDYARSNGGASDEHYSSVCPSDLFNSDVFDIYIAKRNETSGYWEWADTDFWLTIHWDNS